MRRVASWAAAGLLATATAVSAETVAISGARIVTMAGAPIENGSIVCTDGKITAVGASVSIPAGARTIDGKGLTVVPGFVNVGTDLGLVEISQVEMTHDDDESTGMVQSSMRVVDGFHPASKLIAVTRANGITSVLTEPADDNVFSGQSAVFRLDGWTMPEMLVKAPAALHINMGEPPKARGTDRKSAPTTRMGIAALIREQFEKARGYQRKWEDFRAKQKSPAADKKAAKDDKKPSEPDRDFKLDALVSVLKGELPAIVRAHRMDDILTALRLKEEFGFRMILEGGTDAYRVAAQLLKADVPVLLGVTTQPESMESLGAIYENAALLHKARVKFALRTGGHEFARTLPFEAGLAVRYGLPYDAALAAITIEPARILGVSDQIGSLETGKSADLVVFEGDPLEPRSHVKHVFIRGRDVGTRSYQTDLFDRYKDRP